MLYGYPQLNYLIQREREINKLTIAVDGNSVRTVVHLNYTVYEYLNFYVQYNYCKMKYMWRVRMRLCSAERFKIDNAIFGASPRFQGVPKQRQHIYLITYAQKKHS
jgi:hypothetical protein